ncbi:MAG: two pore domain potassium channel family protein, partial [Gammaproteobacteria bacterium]
LETVVTTALVDDRLRHLRCNWMNLFIIAVGLPLLWSYTPMAAVLRSLRLLLVVGILIRFSRTIREILARNKLGYSLIIVAMVILIAGFIIDALEPGIESPWEGMWWALVTITTVGYGDVVPTTPEGRAFGAIIIILGVVVFSLVTANISAYLVGREVSEVEEKVEEVKTQVHQRVGTVERQLREELREEIVEEELDLRREFQRLNRRLDQIERELARVRGERGGGR